MEYLTAKMVGKELGITARRVLALAKSRGLGRQLGGIWLFTRDDVDAMQDRRPGRPRKETR